MDSVRQVAGPHLGPVAQTVDGPAAAVRPDGHELVAGRDAESRDPPPVRHAPDIRPVAGLEDGDDAVAVSRCDPRPLVVETQAVDAGSSDERLGERPQGTLLAREP